MIISGFRSALVSLSVFPSAEVWFRVVGITFVSTTSASIVATSTGFVHPTRDFNPPTDPVRPLLAFVFPSLVEEVFWRGILLTPLSDPHWSRWACGVLVIHVLSHPLAGRTVWPRGRQVFEDPRFLLSTVIVLGGATVCFNVSGGSAWAAAFCHGVPVILWRDAFGGESKMM